eukprot:m51a1_g13961 hypothetical protein (212) ;mRNA; f:954885-955704
MSLRLCLAIWVSLCCFPLYIGFVVSAVASALKWAVAVVRRATEVIATLNAVTTLQMGTVAVGVLEYLDVGSIESLSCTSKYMRSLCEFYCRVLAAKLYREVLERRNRNENLGSVARRGIPLLPLGPPTAGFLNMALAQVAVLGHLACAIGTRSTKASEVHVAYARSVCWLLDGNKLLRNSLEASLLIVADSDRAPAEVHGGVQRLSQLIAG